jgi:hypothetical protein
MKVMTFQMLGHKPWHPSVDVEEMVLPLRGGRTELPQHFTAVEISQSQATDISSVLCLPG